MHTVSPSTELDIVCVGDQLTLTCSVLNVTSLEWRITHPHLVTGEIASQFISSTGRENFILNNSLGVFHYSRISLSPLISVLQVNITTASINGTRVECGTYQGRTFTSTIISVVDNGKLIQLVTELINNINYGLPPLILDVAFLYVSYIL